MTIFSEYLMDGMILCLLAATIILGAITGFIEPSEGVFSRALGGQIVQGLFSITCFILVGVVFWRCGWKIGLLDLVVVVVGSNVGLALHRIQLPGQYLGRVLVAKKQCNKLRGAKN